MNNLRFHSTRFDLELHEHNIEKRLRRPSAAHWWACRRCRARQLRAAMCSSCSEDFARTEVAGVKNEVAFLERLDRLIAQQSIV